MWTKTTLKGRSVTVNIDLSQMGKFVDNIVRKINGPEMGNVLSNFANDVKSTVMEQYIRTASDSKAMTQRRLRLYGSLNPADGVLGKQLNQFSVTKDVDTWRVVIANESLYPLGEGYPYYALFQEVGSNMVRARTFLIQGADYGYKNFEKTVNSAIDKWVKEAKSG
jgi:hypothetical protein